MKITCALWVVMLASFASCKRGSTEITRTIVNETDLNMSVTLIYSHESSLQMEELSPGESLELNKAISRYADRGENETINPSEDIEELIIVNSNGDTLQKDYRCGCHWESNITRERERGFKYVHTYELQIDSLDF